MANVCPFKLCTSTVHGSLCWTTMQKYYCQKFNGMEYFVCPSCVSLCTGTFGQFLTIHRGHFVCFPRNKLLVLREGLYFDNFTIFKYILAMAIGNYDIIPQEVVAHTSSFMQEVVNPHISQQYRNINVNY